MFERSRRFLRQLEISFGDNPSHYQKIIKALQTGLDLSPNSIQEVGWVSLLTSLTFTSDHSQTSLFTSIRLFTEQFIQYQSIH